MSTAKRFVNLALILILGLILVACSDTGTPANNSSDDTLSQTTATAENTSDPLDDEAASEFVINVTGAEEQTIEESGNVFCGNQGMENAVNQLDISGGIISTGYLTLMIPADTPPGTYDVIGSGDDVNMSGEAMTVAFDGEMDNYRNGTGEVVIESVPTAEGEMFVGTLTADLSNDEDDSITLDVAFNVDAGMQSFDEC